jgi:hypothetical protein
VDFDETELDDFARKAAQDAASRLQAQVDRLRVELKGVSSAEAKNRLAAVWKSATGHELPPTARTDFAEMEILRRGNRVVMLPAD